MLRARRHIFAVWMLVVCACPRAQELAEQASDHFDFGKSTLLAPIEHTFYFRNDGAQTLEIANVQLTPPLIAIRGTRRIAPGEEGSVTVRLEQPREKGSFQGEVVVAFKQPATPSRIFRFTGDLVPSIELDPPYGFYLAAQRGEHAQRSLEIVNHEPEPLAIERAEYDGSTFTVALETLDVGRRYRVTLRLNPAAPAGKATETVRLVTSNPANPVISVPANVWVKDRVYAFPHTLDLGTIDLEQIRSDARVAELLTQSLMVYQAGGSNFRVTAETDLPFLVLSAERSPLGDRYQLTASVIPEKLEVGEIRGSIVVSTNDAEFPQLMIPVVGSIATARER